MPLSPTEFRQMPEFQKLPEDDQYLAIDVYDLAFGMDGKPGLSHADLMLYYQNTGPCEERKLADGLKVPVQSAIRARQARGERVVELLGASRFEDALAYAREIGSNNEPEGRRARTLIALEAQRVVSEAPPDSRKFVEAFIAGLQATRGTAISAKLLERIQTFSDGEGSHLVLRLFKHLDRRIEHPNLHPRDVFDAILAVFEDSLQRPSSNAHYEELTNYLRTPNHAQAVQISEPLEGEGHEAVDIVLSRLGEELHAWFSDQSPQDQNIYLHTAITQGAVPLRIVVEDDDWDIFRNRYEYSSLKVVADDEPDLTVYEYDRATETDEPSYETYHGVEVERPDLDPPTIHSSQYQKVRYLKALLASQLDGFREALKDEEFTANFASIDVTLFGLNEDFQPR